MKQTWQIDNRMGIIGGHNDMPFSAADFSCNSS